MGARVNPFSTCFVRPGAVAWLATPASPPAFELAPRVLRGTRFQIIGPHGSGKSTLLQHLERELAARGSAATLTRSPRAAIAHLATKIGPLLADEVESWPAAAWHMVRLGCRLRGVPLVATCHADLGLPTLARTDVTLQSAILVVERVAGEGFAADAEIARLLEAHGGNLREVLFALYDVYEQRAAAAG